MAAWRWRSSSGRLRANSVSRLAELLGHPAVVLVDGLHVLAAGLDLRGGRRPVEDPQEQLVDQLGVVALGRHQPGQLVGRDRRWRRRGSGR